MPGKVLVADDSLNVQKTLTQLLTQAGFEVVTVGNGEHAVRRLAEVKPDLVLADVFMPVRSGFEVCEYIKKSAEFAHVPVLLLASTLEPFDEKEALRVRADGRINKPISEPAAVLNAIQQCLAKAAKAKPAAPTPRAEEFAAVELPAEEPRYEEFATRPPEVSFEGQAAPLGFAEVLEEAPAEAAEALPTAVEEVGAAAEFVEEAPPEEVPVPRGVEQAPAAMLPEAEPEPELAPEPEAEAPSVAAAPMAVSWPGPLVSEPAPTLPEPVEAAPALPAEPLPLPVPAPPEAAPAEPGYRVEKPEVAPAWEMIAPPEGAPEIPAGGEWDSQWKGVEEAAPPEEAAPAGVAEAEAIEAPAEEAAVGAPPPEFAEPEAAPAAVDPALVEAVVEEVLRRLSPQAQVIERLSKEIIRPLVEALLKEKLR